MNKRLKMSRTPVRITTRDRSQNWHIENNSTFMAKEILKAVQKNDADSVARLAAAGAPVNLVNDDNESLLFYSLRHQTGEDIPLSLIEAGADINFISKRSLPPIVPAIENNKIRCVNEIIKRGINLNISFDGCLKYRSDNYTPLMVAALSGRKEIAKILIESGADVNQTNESGFTALMCAARIINFDDIGICEDVEDVVKDNRGNVVKIIMTAITTYDEDLKAEYMELLKVLISAGADKGKCDKNGKTACNMTKDLDAKDILAVMAGKTI